MMQKAVVEFDDVTQRAVRVITDPVEVYRAMHLEYVQGAAATAVRVVEGIDIDAQTIQGIPIPEIYGRSS